MARDCFMVPLCPFNNYLFIISSSLLQFNLFWGTAREYNFNSKQPTPPLPSCHDIPFPAPNLSFRHLMRTVGLGDYREVVGQHQLAAMIQRHFLLMVISKGEMVIGRRDKGWTQEVNPVMLLGGGLVLFGILVHYKTQSTMRIYKRFNQPTNIWDSDDEDLGG